MLGLKTVIYVHGEEITTRTSYDAEGTRRRSSLKQADAAVAVSRFTAKTLNGEMGIPMEKIELISNGVDLVRFHSRSKKKDLVARYGLAGKTVVLTVGRLCPRKGIDRVIESLPRVLTAVEDVAYLVVGDGPYRMQLEAIAANLGVQDRVVFAGPVADGELVDHYALGDIFIMANREMPDGDTEGFGLVFLEANACGIPVIAGRAGGSVDAVTDGANGILVDGDDPGQIAAAIEKLATDAELREHLVTRGLEVAANSGWPSRVQQFLALCDRLSPQSRNQ
jgi:phosphatidylinositol alpha-1,6-mannosyltransferase